MKRVQRVQNKDVGYNTLYPILSFLSLLREEGMKVDRKGRTQKQRR